MEWTSGVLARCWVQIILANGIVGYGTLCSKARVHPATQIDWQARQEENTEVRISRGRLHDERDNFARSMAVVDSSICIHLVKGRSQRVLIAQILHVSPPPPPPPPRLHAARSHSFSPRRSTDYCNSRLILLRLIFLLLLLLCRRSPVFFLYVACILYAICT